jgi:hypothetical protein
MVDGNADRTPNILPEIVPARPVRSSVFASLSAWLRSRASISVSTLGAGVAHAMEHKDQIDRLVLVCGVGGAVTPTISAGWERRYERMKARYQGIANGQPKLGGASRLGRVPPIRSAGEFERFAVAYHPYGPVGATMHKDSPAITFLYAEIMATSGGPPTVEVLPCFGSRAVTPDEAMTVRFPVLVVGGTDDPLFPQPELEEMGSLFPYGRTVLFRGGPGTQPFYERADRFNDLVVDFLCHGHDVCAQNCESSFGLPGDGRTRGHLSGRSRRGLSRSQSCP